MAGELWNSVESPPGLLRDSVTGELLTAHATQPCPCCTGGEFVELRPCCIPAGPGDVDTPFPPGGADSRWFLALADLQTVCAARQFGYLAFFPDKDGVAAYCMQYNLTVRPPIPASALPVDAVILGLDGDVICYGEVICANETICPPCPSCCQERSWPYRCMRNIDPHPSNPLDFKCNYGREYLTTYTMSSTYYRKRWQYCAGSVSGPPVSFCAPFDQEDTTSTTVGNMSFRKACAPDFEASCTGEQVSEVNQRYETFGALPFDCSSGTLTGGGVVTNTFGSTTPCTELAGTPTFPVPDEFLQPAFEDAPCVGDRINDYRCFGGTGLLWQTENWVWAFDRACFDGSLFWEFTRQAWYIDVATCDFPRPGCGATPIVPCLNELCYDEKLTYSAEWAIQILSVEQCGGPWETAQENDANGYPIDGGGFFDGWAITGVGDAAEFL